MDSHNSFHSKSPTEQAGLEVVSHTGLEVLHDRYSRALPEATTPSGTSPAYAAYEQYPEHFKPSVENPDPGAPDDKQRKKRLWLIVGGVIAIVVILAAVLGGVLGSKAANEITSESGDSGSSGENEGGNSGGSSGGSSGGGNSGETGTSGDTGNTTNNTTTRPQSIRQGSALSVTGWRKPDGSVETYLLFQDTKDGLQFSWCDTSLRSPGNESTCWASPVSLHKYAEPGTPLATSTILWGEKYQPQIEVFYTGPKMRLLAVNINNESIPITNDDDANKRNLSTGPDSSLGAYWPYTIFQGSDGKLHNLYNGLGDALGPSGDLWFNKSLDITALVASGLAIVPTSTTLRRINATAGYAVFYQTPENKLAVAIPGLDSLQRPPWLPTTFPDIILPKQAPIAAFSVARAGDDDSQHVDTSVLYLDAADNINVVSSDSTEGSQSATAAWKTAKPDALRGADKDTNIACLNMATAGYNATNMPMLLEPASEETRCYFQRGGWVVEVKLDVGTGDWVNVGNVPMP